MGKAKTCDDCSSDIRRFYCSCLQIFICSKCSSNHEDHVMYNLNEKLVDLDHPIKCKSVNHTLKYFESLSEQVNTEITRIEQNSDKPPELRPIYTYSPDLLNKLTKNTLSECFLFLPDSGNKINRFSLNTKEFHETNIIIDENIKGPFWVLEWKNFLVIVGGTNRRIPNDKIYRADKESGDVQAIGSHPKELREGFAALIFEDFLYLVGGRYKKGLKFFNSREILRIDLNTGRPENSLKMCNERSDVSACVIKNTLYVISSNCPGTIEIKNLKDDSDFTNYETQYKLTEGTCLYSYRDQLFLFQGSNIFCCKDLENIEFEEVKSDDSLMRLDEGLKWNCIRPPFIDEQFNVFFSESFFYLVNLKDNTRESIDYK